MSTTCHKIIRCSLSVLHLIFPNNINKAQSFVAASFATFPFLITNQSLILSVAVLSFESAMLYYVLDAQLLLRPQHITYRDLNSILIIRIMSSAERNMKTVAASVV
jgi:hypothetical protein